jgi:two-component system phosphate regulon sensor histidine kinase PhoR
MAGTILLIVAFQCYWLQRLYKEEYSALQRKADILLKETVQQFQMERVKGLPFLARTDEINKIEIITEKQNGKGEARHKTIIRAVPGVALTRGDVHVKAGISKRLPEGSSPTNDTTTANISRRTTGDRDSAFAARVFHFRGHDDYPPPPLPNLFFARALDSLKRTSRNSKDSLKVQQLILQLDQLNDSIPLTKLDSQYNKALRKEGISLPFYLKTAVLPDRRAGMDSVPVKDKLATRFAITGFDEPVGYYAIFEQPFSYISKKLLLPGCVSLLLIGFTIVSFAFIYRNLLVQRRLADIKNEFISNITHELKTPVATVNVAIEALRNFNALQDAARTKEYLDISAIELQRLGLLIDKVLRLSMFENHKVALQIDCINFTEIVEEVVAGMRLQLEKTGATVELVATEKVILAEVDRLHITSVIYNLLDNVLKYSTANPLIHIYVEQDDQVVIFSVADNGIGIPAIYTRRVFEKFFRVPRNDRHDTKGYGLGLSYVAHIVKLHKGSVVVESEEGKGSTFIIKLPLRHE